MSSSPQLEPHIYLWILRLWVPLASCLGFWEAVFLLPLQACEPGTVQVARAI